MNASFEINGPDMRLIADKAVEKAVAATSRQALDDCNYYCKQDTGALIQSSSITMDGKEGVLIWNMPYAEYQYYLPGTHTDKNENACPKWCEVAENNHKDQWQATFINTLKSEGLG